MLKPCLVLLLACLLSFVLAARESSARRHDATIENLQFQPAQITIAPGDSVSWTNNDDRDHTVLARDGSFRSGNIKPGATFEHTFPKAGRFAYGCAYHPRMSGEVIVKER